MIDWANCKPEDFKIQYQVEEIESVGDRYVFPVNVYHGDTEEFAFMKMIPIKTEFFQDIRKLDGWRDALSKVFRTRIRDDINIRINAGKVAIEDKMELLSEEKEQL